MDNRFVVRILKKKKLEERIYLPEKKKSKKKLKL